MSDTPRTDAGYIAHYAEHDHNIELCRQLERELAAAQKDAERYRHVRKDPSMLLHLSNRDFDAAIDAAMAKEKAP